MRNKDVSTWSDRICGNDALGNWNSSTVYFNIGETTTTTTTTTIWPCELPGDYPSAEKLPWKK